jgi:hypothetical protein
MNFGFPSAFGRNKKQFHPSIEGRKRKKGRGKTPFFYFAAREKKEEGCPRSLGWLRFYNG